MASRTRRTSQNPVVKKFRETLRVIQGGVEAACDPKEAQATRAQLRAHRLALAQEVAALASEADADDEAGVDVVDVTEGEIVASMA